MLRKPKWGLSSSTSSERSPVRPHVSCLSPAADVGAKDSAKTATKAAEGNMAQTPPKSRKYVNTASQFFARSGNP